MDKIILKNVQHLLYPTYEKDMQHYRIVHTADIIYQKISAMPTLLRLSTMFGLYAFDVYGGIIGNQQRKWKQWQHSPFKSCRGFVAFFSKLIYATYFDLCQEHEHVATY